MDQHSRGHLDCHRVGRTGVVHATAEVYEQSYDGPTRVQVPNVQRGVTYGAVVYDDHFIKHDYSTHVSSERYETVRVLRRAHAVAGQCVERHFVAAHGAFIRQVWAEVARYSRTCHCRGHVMVFLQHIARVIGRFYRRLAYRINGRHFHGMDASADQRLEPAATRAIPTRNSSHEHATAGRGRDRHSYRNHHPYVRHGEVFTRLPRTNQANGDG